MKLLTLFLLFFLRIFILLIPACSFFVFLFRLTNWKISRVAFISIFRSRHWELLCKTAVWQDTIKIVNFFYKIGVSFQYSLLNKKIYKFIKNEILDRYFSKAIVKRSILHLNRITIFLAQLWMAASNHLFNKYIKKVGRWIIK